MRPYEPTKLPKYDLNWEKFFPEIGLANRALARYDGTLEAMINPQLLLSPLTTQEAVLSSRIEGTQATLEEVMELEAEGEGKIPETETEKDVQEIFNYRNALREATVELESRPISLNMIKKIHSILLDSVRGQYKRRGEFRQKQNWIGSPSGSREDATYVPPKPGQIMNLMTNLEEYIHQQEKDELVQLAIIHAQFELIHPFLDGNGRVGRILVPLFLYEKAILHEPMFYLSSYLEKNREEYYKCLGNISKNNDWNSWVVFFLEAIIEQANSNKEKVKAILDLYEDMKGKVREVTQSQYSIQVLDAIFENPLFKRSDFINRTEIPKSSAERILKSMLNAGLLTIKRQAKGRRPALLEFKNLLEIVN